MCSLHHVTQLRNGYVTEGERVTASERHFILGFVRERFMTWVCACHVLDGLDFYEP